MYTDAELRDPANGITMPNILQQLHNAFADGNTDDDNLTHLRYLVKLGIQYTYICYKYTYDTGCLAVWQTPSLFARKSLTYLSCTKFLLNKIQSILCR